MGYSAGGSGKAANQVVLSAPENWEEWILQIELQAEALGVWKYINPATTKELIEPEHPGEYPEPPSPTATEAEIRAADFQRRKLEYNMTSYQVAARTVIERQKALTGMRDKLVASVSDTLAQRVRREKTPRQIIQLLQRELVPNKDKMGALAQINLIKKISDTGSRDYTTWAEQVLVLTTQLEAHDEAFQFHPAFIALMFLNNIRATNLGFWREWNHRFDPDADSLTKADLIDMITAFKNEMRHVDRNKQVNSINQGVNNRPEGHNTPKPSQKRTDEIGKCPGCGISHRLKLPKWWENCYALWVVKKPSIPSNGFTVNNEKREKIHDYLDAHPDEAKSIEQWNPPSDLSIPLYGKPGGGYRVRQGDLTTNSTYTANTLFAVNNAANSSAIGADDFWKNKVIYDTGANVHVFNHISWFLKKGFSTDVDFTVTAGGQALHAIGKGTARIHLTNHRGQKTPVTFDEALYIPEMHTNVVAGLTMLSNGYFWNQQAMTMEHKGVRLGKIRVHANQGILDEKNYHQEPMRDWQVNAISRAPKPPQGGEADLWHRRFGHPGQKAMKLMMEGTQGGTIIGPTTVECEVCAVSKPRRVISRLAPEGRPWGPGASIAFDLDYYPNQCYNGDKYWCIFTCITTNMRFFYSFARKEQSRDALMQFRSFLGLQFGMKMKLLQSDGERSLLTTQVRDELAKDGVLLYESAPSTPSQNGFAERSGQTVKEKARALQQESQLPLDLHNEIFRTSVYLLNRTPMERQGKWVTPYEEWWREIKATVPEYRGLPESLKPSIRHLRAFGCMAFPMTVNALDHVTSHRVIPYHEQRAHIGYLIGYRGNHQYIIWVPSLRTHRLIRSANVQFNEAQTYDAAREITAQATFIQEEELLANLGGEIQEVDDYISLESFGLEPPKHSSNSQRDQPKSLETEENTTHSRLTPPAQDADITVGGDGSHGEETEAPQPLTPQSTSTSATMPTQIQEINDLLNTIEFADHEQEIISENSAELTEETTSDMATVDDLPQAGGSRPTAYTGGIDTANIIDEPRIRKPSAKASGNAFTAHQFVNVITKAMHRGRHVKDMPPPPRNYREAMNSPFANEWRNAMKREFEKLRIINCFRKASAEEAKGKEILDIIWVYTYKDDANGFVTEFKARMVVRGDMQQRSLIDYYTSTLSIKSVRVLLALAAALNLEARQYDVTAAFPHAELEETVYCKGPQLPGEAYAEFVLLLRALYGLRGSPLAWFKHLVKFMLKLGFTQSKEDPCIFIKGEVILFFYVDDIIILYPTHCTQQWKTLHNELMAAFDIRDQGDLKWFLGIEIRRNRKTKEMWLSQESYIDQIAQRFLGEEIAAGKVNRYATPLPLEPIEPHDGEATPREIEWFQSLLGSMVWPSTITRIDISIACVMLAVHMHNPSQRHIQLAKRTLWYLYGHKDLSLKYSGDKASNTVIAATDASFANDSATRRSMEGYVILLFGGPIAWKATRQKSVTTSSTEAELMALNHGAQERMALSRLFEEIGLKVEDPALVWCDNKQTVRLTANSGSRLTTRLRHVDINHMWIREQVQRGSINVQWIRSEDMPADGLTKALTAEAHLRFLHQVGLQRNLGGDILSPQV